MFLSELADPSLVRLLALTVRLREKYRDKNLSLNDFLTHLRNNDIFLDKKDIYDMVKKPPLKNFISNIEQDQIIFKNDEPASTDDEDKNKKIVKSMAKKSMKNEA
jgi:hypothetical protein